MPGPFGINPSTIVRILERFRLDIIGQIPESHDITRCFAWQLQDCCLANTLFGYLAPVSISCLRSLQLLSPISTCLDEDCQASHGNKTQWAHGDVGRDKTLGTHLAKLLSDPLIAAQKRTCMQFTLILVRLVTLSWFDSCNELIRFNSCDNKRDKTHVTL